jgi:hypothetical protein
VIPLLIPSVTATPHALLADGARDVLCAVAAMDWPAGRDARRPLNLAFIALGDAIDTYECQPGPVTAAEAARASEELMIAAKCCDPDQISAAVSGQEGEN